MRDPCQSKWSSGKWSQLWSRHEKLWSRPLKPGTRRFRVPILRSGNRWSMADSNRRPLACQASASTFRFGGLRLNSARLRTSRIAPCRSNCGPNRAPTCDCRLRPQLWYRRLQTNRFEDGLKGYFGVSRGAPQRPLRRRRANPHDRRWRSSSSRLPSGGHVGGSFRALTLGLAQWPTPPHVPLTPRTSRWWR